jgi:hypothetical protein
VKTAALFAGRVFVVAALGIAFARWYLAPYFRR